MDQAAVHTPVAVLERMDIDHYVNRRSTVHRMTRMGVPEPVWRHLAPDACSPGCLLDNP